MIANSTPPFVSHCVGKTLDAGRLELVEVIGEGACGIVYLAVERQGDAPSSSTSSPTKKYAVKVLQKAADCTVVGQCQSREIVTHKIASSHPNVLTLHDVFEDETALYLVLDYCPGGDLYGAIVERHVFARNDALLKSVFVQILDAVQSCHNQGIYHRDLKPDNIFVSADGTQVYLGDFGLATDEALSKTFRSGSSYYMSPECIGEEQNFHSFYNETSDVWSLGVILTNMIASRNPWRIATTNDDHFYEYLSNPGCLSEMFPISKAANDVLKRVFTFSPSQRISLAELRSAVLAVDSFFLTEGEVSTGDNVKSAAAAYTPRIPVFATPDLPSKSTFDSMHDYPDEEYLFASPDPDDYSLYDLCTSSSEVSTPSTLFSDTSTLFGDLSPGVSSKGKEPEMDWGSGQESVVFEKQVVVSQGGPASRFLSKLLA